MSHHNIIKKIVDNNLILTIDEKTENKTWVFRIIDSNKKGSEFSCLINMLDEDTCSVEIARARVGTGSESLIAYIKNLFFVILNKSYLMLRIRKADKFLATINKEDAAILANFIKCKPLFKFLKIKNVEWQRALDGPVKKYKMRG